MPTVTPNNSVKVAIRVRPLIAREKSFSSAHSWRVKDNTLFLSEERNRSPSQMHSFDLVFDQNKTTHDIYDNVAKPIISAAIQGYHGTIFAYGQTASGKTYTMMGEEGKCPGVIQLAIEDVFNRIDEHSEREFLIRMSVMELYNEALTDLLTPERRSLQLREQEKSVIVQNLEESVVDGPNQIFSLLDEAAKRRHVGETNMNEKSSRSHTIVRLIIESRVRIGYKGNLSNSDSLLRKSMSTPVIHPEESTEDDFAVNESHLHFVDLAGSERVAQTGATGDRLREGQKINRSLFELSHVISKLSEQADNHKSAFINFRNSMLTRLLQNALSGNSYTSIICTISPAFSNVEQSISTLRFAESAKRIKTAPVVNEYLSDNAKYKREIAEKEQEIELLNQKLKERDEELEKRRVEDLNKMIERLHNFYEGKEECSSNTMTIGRNLRRQTWCPRQQYLEIASAAPPPPLPSNGANVDYSAASTSQLPPSSDGSSFSSITTIHRPKAQPQLFSAALDPLTEDVTSDITREIVLREDDGNNDDDGHLKREEIAVETSAVLEDHSHSNNVNTRRRRSRITALRVPCIDGNMPGPLDGDQLLDDESCTDVKMSGRRDSVIAMKPERSGGFKQQHNNHLSHRSKSTQSLNNTSMVSDDSISIFNRRRSIKQVKFADSSSSIVDNEGYSSLFNTGKQRRRSILSTIPSLPPRNNENGNEFLHPSQCVNNIKSTSRRSSILLPVKNHVSTSAISTQTDRQDEDIETKKQLEKANERIEHMKIEKEFQDDLITELQNQLTSFKSIQSKDEVLFNDSILMTPTTSKKVYLANRRAELQRNLQHETECRKNLETELAQMHEAIRNLENTIERQDCELKERDGRLAQLKESLEKMKNDDERDEHHVRAVENKKKLVDEMSAKKMETNEQLGEISMEKQRLEALRKELSAAEEKLTLDRESFEKDKLELLNQETNRCIEQLNDRSSLLVNTPSVSTNDNSDSHALSKELADYKKKYSNLRDMYDNCVDENKELHEELDLKDDLVERIREQYKERLENAEMMSHSGKKSPISDNQKKVADLKMKNLELLEKLKSFEVENAQFQNEMSKLREELEDKHSTLNNANIKITQTQDELTETQIKLKTSKDHCEEILSELTKSNRNATRLESELEAANLQAKNLETELIQVKSSLVDKSTLQNERDELESKLTEAQTKLNNSEETVKKILAELNEMEQKNEDLVRKNEANVRKYEENIKSLNTNLLENQNQLKESDENVQKYKEIIDELNSTLSEVRSKLKDSSIQYDKLNEEVQIKISEMSSQLANSQSNELVAENKITATEQQLADTEMKLAESIAEVQNSKSHCSQLEAKVNDLNEKHLVLQENLKDANSKVSQLERELSHEKTTISDANNKIVQIENNLLNTQTEKAELLEQFSSTIAEFDKMKEKNSHLMQLIEEKEKKLEELSNNVKSKEAEVEEKCIEKDLELTNAQEKLLMAEKSCGELRGKVNDLNEKLQKLQDNLEKENLNELKSDLSQAQAKLLDKSNAFSNAQIEKTKLHNELKEITNELNETKMKKEELLAENNMNREIYEKQLDELKSKLEHQAHKKTEDDKKIAEMEEDFLNAQDKVAKLQEKFSFATKELDQMKGKNLELMKLMEEKNGQLEDLRKVQVNDLSEKHLLLQENLKDANSKVSQLERELSHEKTTVSDANNKIVQIENNLLNTQTEKAELLEQFSSTIAEFDKIKEKNSHLMQLIEEKEKKLEELSNNVKSKEAEVEEKFTEKDLELTNAQEKLLIAEKSCDELRGKVNDLNEKLQKLQDNLEKENLNELKSDLSQAQAELLDKSNAFSNAQIEKTKLDNELREITNELIETKMKKEELLAENNMNREIYEKQLDELKSKLEHQAHTKTEDDKKIAEMEEDFLNAQDEVAKLQEKFSFATKELDQMKEKNLELMKLMEEKNGQLEDLRKVQVNDLSEKHLVLQENLKDANSKVSQLERELSHEKTTISDANNKIVQMENNLLNTQTEKAELLEKFSSTIAEFDKIKEKNSHLMQLIEEKEKKLEELSNNVKSKEAEVEEKCIEKDLELTNAQEKLLIAEKSCDELRGKVNGLNEKLQKLQDNLEKENLNELKSDLSQAQAKLLDKSNAFSNAQIEKTKLDNELREITNELNETKMKKEELLAENNMNREIYEKQLDELKSKIEHQAHKKTEDDKKIAEMEEDFLNAQAEVSKLQEKFSFATKELDQMKGKNLELMKLMEEKNEQLEDLRKVQKQEEDVELQFFQLSVEKEQFIAEKAEIFSKVDFVTTRKKELEELESRLDYERTNFEKARESFEEEKRLCEKERLQFEDAKKRMPETTMLAEHCARLEKNKNEIKERESSLHQKELSLRDQEKKIEEYWKSLRKEQEQLKLKEEEQEQIDENQAAEERRLKGMMEEFTKRTEELSRRRESLLTKDAVSEAELGEKLEEIKMLNSKINTLTLKKAELELDKNEIQRDLTMRTEELSHLKGEKFKIESKLNDVMEKCRNLEGVNEKLQNQMAALEKEENHVKEVSKKKVDDLDARYEAATDELRTSLSEMEKERDVLKSLLTEAEQEISKKDIEYRNLFEENTTLLANLKEAKESLEDVHNQLKSKIQSLRIASGRISKLKKEILEKDNVIDTSKHRHVKQMVLMSKKVDAMKKKMKTLVPAVKKSSTKTTECQTVHTVSDEYSGFYGPNNRLTKVRNGFVVMPSRDPVKRKNDLPTYLQTHKEVDLEKPAESKAWNKSPTVEKEKHSEEKKKHDESSSVKTENEDDFPRNENGGCLACGHCGLIITVPYMDPMEQIHERQLLECLQNDRMIEERIAFEKEIERLNERLKDRVCFECGGELPKVDGIGTPKRRRVRICLNDEKNEKMKIASNECCEDGVDENAQKPTKSFPPIKFDFNQPPCLSSHHRANIDIDKEVGGATLYEALKNRGVKHPVLPKCLLTNNSKKNVKSTEPPLVPAPSIVFANDKNQTDYDYLLNENDDASGGKKDMPEWEIAFERVMDKKRAEYIKRLNEKGTWHLTCKDNLHWVIAKKSMILRRAFADGIVSISSDARNSKRRQPFTDKTSEIANEEPSSSTKKTFKYARDEDVEFDLDESFATLTQRFYGDNYP